MNSALLQRWTMLRNSLRLRLAITAAGVIVVVSAAGTLIDYQRERTALVERVVTALRDQAQLLALGLDMIDQPAAMQRYVHDFCETLNAHISPGHIIIVLNQDRQILAMSTSPQEDAAMRALINRDSVPSVVRLGEHQYAQARMDEENGMVIVVAQDLANIDGEMRGMLWSHITSTMVTVGSVMPLLFLVAHFWAVRPLRQLTKAIKGWTSRDFTARSTFPGPSELQYVTGELDRMAEELHRHERHRLADMEKARKIQHNLLPRLATTDHGVKLAGQYWPLEHVAGDLYDIFELPDGRMVATVIDIAGHGVSAALLTGVVKLSLRYQLTQTPDLTAALARVNQDIVACTLGRTFAVLSIGIWASETGTWTYAACGHEGCTVFRKNEIRHLTSTGPMLGMFPDAQWETCQIPLKEGDRVFLYTDGVTEAGVLEEGLLGTQGVEGILAVAADLSLDEQVSQVMHEAARRGHGQATDDITMLAFEVLSPTRTGHRPTNSNVPQAAQG